LLGTPSIIFSTELPSRPPSALATVNIHYSLWNVCLYACVCVCVYVIKCHGVRLQLVFEMCARMPVWVYVCMSLNAMASTFTSYDGEHEWLHALCAFLCVYVSAGTLFSLCTCTARYVCVCLQLKQCEYKLLHASMYACVYVRVHA
jgi:hypothetical protein